MTSAAIPFVRGAAIGLVLLVPFVAGCSGQIECKTEIATGSATYAGSAVGKAEDLALRNASVRDACRQKCAAEKAVMIDACTSTCITDAASQKIGAKTTCGRK